MFVHMTNNNNINRSRCCCYFFYRKAKIFCSSAKNESKRFQLLNDYYYI